MFTSSQIAFIKGISRSWPESLQIKVDIPTIRIDAHPLLSQFQRFEGGLASSFPYFKNELIQWVTIGGSPEELQRAIEQLRAWIIPSFGWEDKVNAFVPPGEGMGGLSPLIVPLSPGGYYKWVSRKDHFEQVCNKLVNMHGLDVGRPEHIYSRVPTLFELRQQFTIALATKDMDVGQAVIDQINHHQLDSAVNTKFMQIRLWHEFREYEKIANAVVTENLVRLRMPCWVRVNIVNSFYERYLSELEEKGLVHEAQEKYSDEVHPRIGMLLDACRDVDGQQVLHCIAYKAKIMGDRGTADRLLTAFAEDAVLKKLFLNMPPPKCATIPSSPEVNFQLARDIDDWRGVQDFGLQMLRSDLGNIPPGHRVHFREILRKSLSYLPNPEIRNLLEKEIPLDTVETSREVIPPQTWREYFEQMKAGKHEVAQRFLAIQDRVSLGSLKYEEIEFLFEALEELFTDPVISKNQIAHQIALGSLVAFIEDFVSEPEFPRGQFAGLYLQLLRIWGVQKQGSVNIPDGQLLLTIASAVLQARGTEEKEIIGILRDWWMARRVIGQLPFLLETLELLSLYTNADHTDIENLWVDGASLINRSPETVSPSEYILWREIGGRIGLASGIIKEYLALDVAGVSGEKDVIAAANLTKIAIVSLAEKAALAARDIIARRTNAKIIVVADKDAGAGTENAKTADVIVFVWASNKHAVYRAFDRVRDRIAYVQGTGAASIVRALENYLLRDTYAISA